MGKEIKYTHESLVKAVDRLEELGDFNTRVDASQKAGDMLNEALDKMEKQVYDQVKEVENQGNNRLQPMKGTEVNNNEFSL